MQTVYLHIGQPKTATTTLQALFSKNKEWLFSKGILYPKPPENTLYENQDAHHFLVDGIRHSLFGWKWNNPKWVPISANQAWSTILEQIEQCPGHDVLISAEGFFMLGHGTPYNLRRFLSWLQKELSKFDVKIICYLRRQDLWLESNYNQVVKSTITSETKTIGEWLNEGPNSRFVDYYSILSHWANAFTRENITIRPFERIQLKNNKIIDDFLYALGLQKDKNLAYPEEENIRLSAPCLEYRRISNALNISYELKEILGERLQSISDACMADNKKIIPTENANALMKRCADGNHKLALNYLKKNNGSLFLDDLDQDNNNVYTGLSINELALITAALNIETQNDIISIQGTNNNQKNRLDHQRRLIDELKERIDALEKIINKSG